MTENSRKYNCEIINARANAKEIKVGDRVIYKASGGSRLKFISKWDPKWSTRTCGLDKTTENR